MRSLACLAAALALLMSSADAAAASAPAPRQKRLLEAGKAAFERLRKDDRRRRHRDAWEAVERLLDQAVQAAPGGPLAPEAALWAAKARAELYERSRVLADVRAAVAAYRGVDEAHPESPQGLRALLAGVQLGTRAHERSETALAARRLAARYPRSAEAKAALALVPAPKVQPPVAAGAGARPQRPVEVGDDDDDDDSDERTADAGGAGAAAMPAAAARAAAIAKAMAALAAEREPKAALTATGAEREPKASATAAEREPRASATAGEREASVEASATSGSSAAAPTGARTIAASASPASNAGSTSNARPTSNAGSSSNGNRTATTIATSTTNAGSTSNANRTSTTNAASTTNSTSTAISSAASSRPSTATPPAPPAAGEPEVDIPREAIHVVEEMVQAARKDGTAQASPPPEPPKDDDAGPEPEAPEAPPQRTPRLVKLAKEAVARLTEPQNEPDAEDKARELRAAALAGGASIAAQLGLKVRRVVIDPGHGGKDTGAIGPHGVREKDIALAIARRLATRLRALGLTAVLTRNDDSFVALDDRTRIANEAKADLFVSIHCNAARQRKLAGIETWTLNVASDRYAARLAAFENAEAERTVSDLRLILADLATKANAGDARELAQSVQTSLVRNLRSRVGKITDHGVKQALFYVLLGTHMPSILVETAFLSNPSEEARLRSARYQEATAEAIARGVKDFVDGRQRLARAP